MPGVMAKITINVLNENAGLFEGLYVLYVYSPMYSLRYVASYSTCSCDTQHHIVTIIVKGCVPYSNESSFTVGAESRSDACSRI